MNILGQGVEIIESFPVVKGPVECWKALRTGKYARAFRLCHGVASEVILTHTSVLKFKFPDQAVEINEFNMNSDFLLVPVAE